MQIVKKMGTIILRKIVGFIFAYYSSLLRVTALFVNALRESNDSHQIKRAFRRILELSKMAVSSPARLYPAIGVMAGARYRSHIRMATSSTIPHL